jgi:hypothetical protein
MCGPPCISHNKIFKKFKSFMSASHLPHSAMRSAIFRDGEIRIGDLGVVRRLRVTNSTEARLPCYTFRFKVVTFII